MENDRFIVWQYSSLTTVKYKIILCFSWPVKNYEKLGYM